MTVAAALCQCVSAHIASVGVSLGSIPHIECVSRVNVSRGQCVHTNMFLTCYCHTHPTCLFCQCVNTRVYACVYACVCQCVWPMCVSFVNVTYPVRLSCHCVKSVSMYISTCVSYATVTHATCPWCQFHILNISFCQCVYVCVSVCVSVCHCVSNAYGQCESLMILSNMQRVSRVNASRCKCVHIDVCLACYCHTCNVSRVSLCQGVIAYIPTCVFRVTVTHAMCLLCLYHVLNVYSSCQCIGLSVCVCVCVCVVVECMANVSLVSVSHIECVCVCVCVCVSSVYGQRVSCGSATY